MSLLRCSHDAQGQTQKQALGRTRHLSLQAVGLATGHLLRVSWRTLHPSIRSPCLQDCSPLYFAYFQETPSPFYIFPENSQASLRTHPSITDSVTSSTDFLTESKVSSSGLSATFTILQSNVHHTIYPWVLMPRSQLAHSFSLRNQRMNDPSSSPVALAHSFGCSEDEEINLSLCFED